MKKFLTKLSFLVILSIGTTQSTMIQSIAMSPEDFAEKSWHTWRSVTIGCKESENYITEYDQRLKEEYPQENGYRYFFSKLMAEVLATDDWIERAKRILYISDFTLQKCSPEEAIPIFEDFFPPYLGAVDQEFQQFTSHMLTFLCFLIPLDQKNPGQKAARKQRLKAKMLDGELGHGVFFLESFYITKPSANTTEPDYAEEAIQHLPKTDYFEPYKKAIRLMAALKKLKIQPTIEESFKNLFRELCDCLQARQSGCEATEILLEKVKPWFFNAFQEGPSGPLNSLSLRGARDALLQPPS